MHAPDTDLTETNGAPAPGAEPLAAEFAAATSAQWEALVRAKQRDPERPLVTALEDGLEARWLYTPGDALAPDPGGMAGADPFVRGVRVGTPWAIRQETAAPDRGRANRQILEDLEGGATEVLLTIARDGRPGVPIADVDGLEEVLVGVQLDLAPIALSPGTAAGGGGAELLEVWRRSGHPADQLRGSLRVDPLAALAEAASADGPRLDAELAAAAAMLARVRTEFPQVRVLAVDTTPYVEAGAGAALELALALAGGLAHLRAGEAAGLDPAAVAAALEFTLVAGADQFLEIAKLRAARRLWAAILAECGVASAQRHSAVYVRTSGRMASVLDPWVNLLRTTTAAFAAAVAGADGITVLPFDAPVRAPGALGRRMARNTQLILLEESSLHRVADPAGGSWYVESLTDALAHAAWSELQAFERAGGIVPALASGEIARRVAEATARRHDQIAHRRRALTGVNMFPLLGDDGLATAEAEADTAAGDGAVRGAASGGSAAGDAVAGTAAVAPRAGALAPVRDGAQFETLRARAAALAAAGPGAPSILLACLGPLAAHVNVAQWAKSFFEAGGVATVSSGVQPDAAAHAALLAEHGLHAAALCPGRDGDAAQQAEIVAALRDAGARVIYLVGAGDAAATAVGADAGVREGVDMVAVLGELLDRLAGNAASAADGATR